MRINISNPLLRRLFVYLNGDLIENVIEVDSDLGIVKFFKYVGKGKPWQEVFASGEVVILEEKIS